MVTVSSFRFLFKNKVLAIINIAGLALGVSVCLVIVLYVDAQLTYDNHHAHADRIFRITSRVKSEASTDHVAISSMALAAELKEQFPEVEQTVRFIAMGEECPVRGDDVVFREPKIYRADAAAFEVFTYPMIRGDANAALARPQQVVLTKTIATKYFGEDDPINKLMLINEKEYLVSGVMEDLPFTSDLLFTMLVSMDSSDMKADWFDFSYYNYVLIRKESNHSHFAQDFEKKLATIAEEKYNIPLMNNAQNMTISLHVHPLLGMHFQNQLLYDTPKGNILYVYVLSGVALLILLIASLNYINFSIVHSLERSKEAGVRKVVGATFAQLVGRYLGESLLVTLLACVVAAGIALLLLPSFNSLTHSNHDIGSLFTWKMLVTGIALWLCVGVLAGGYPAFFMSSVKPVSALAGKVNAPRGRAVRKVAMVIQFIISIGLVLCTVIIHRQMAYIRNVDLGFVTDNLVVVKLPADSVAAQHAYLLRDQVKRYADVASVSVSGIGAVPGSPADQHGSLTLTNSGKNEVRMVSCSYVDNDYFLVLGARMKEGRSFDLNRPSDAARSIVVNEALVSMMGWMHPLKEKILWLGQWREVIGVIRDMHFQSLHNRVEPQVFVLNESKPGAVIIRFSTPSKAVMSILEQEWAKIYEHEPFSAYFLDRALQEQYRGEEVIRQILTGFSILTIVLSCAGLFGISSISVHQRKKEIGIRKVVGAGFFSIALLFSREYVRLVLLSVLVVVPLAIYVMQNWLDTFKRQVPIQLWIYIAVGAGALLIAVVIVILSILKESRKSTRTLLSE